MLIYTIILFPKDYIKLNLLRRIQEIADTYFSDLRLSFPAASVFIGVHVRRTDYIEFIQKTLDGNAFSSKFYIRAMRTAVTFIKAKAKG